MASIAFLLLCHKDPEGVIRQVEQLTAAGDSVVLHFDARGAEADHARLREALVGRPGVAFTPRRIRCGWGEWSLVEATLEAAREAMRSFPQATHFYMLSGDCMPIKSARHAHALLDAEPADFIESVDFHTSGWIRTGLREERLIYRHLFNERRNKRLFYAALEAQRRLGLRRSPPDDLQIMIGSQWWCLRRATLRAILEFCAERTDVMRFFRRTWIPDETFFQTLVRHLVPESEIRSRTLTFLVFTDYGMPATFHNDHYDLLLGQDYLFARKISPDAVELRTRLGTLWASDRADFAVSGDGRRLFAYLTGRGRVGRRFAPRFWEAEASIGRERELLLLACKKWHLGKELAGRIQALTGIPALGYLFDEDAVQLPDLGGIETSLAKRTRHRRALMRMLFEAHGSDRLLICLDPGSFELFEDFAADRARTPILHVEFALDDAFLADHAHRLGLTGKGTDPAMLERLLPVLRNDIRFESEQLNDAGFAGLGRLRQGAPATANAAALAGFLGLSARQVQTIATADLFEKE
jgi:hypothetical protein